MRISITTIEILGYVKKAERRKTDHTVYDDTGRRVPDTKLRSLAISLLLRYESKRYYITGYGEAVLSAFNLGKRYR